YVVDTGPDAATSGYTGWLGLIEELGLGAKLTSPSGVLGMVRDGRIVDIDPAKPLKAAMTPALSARAKARLVTGVVRLRGQMKGIDSYALNLSADLDDPAMTAEAFAVKYFGREVTDYLIDPAIRLSTGSGASEASSLSVLGVLTAWSVALVNIEGGFEVVPRGIAARLAHPVRYGARATAVDDSGDGVRVTYTDRDGTEGTVQADACVIGAMYHVAREIWQPLDGLAPAFAPNL